MQAQAFKFTFADPIPMLDEEFDKVEATPAADPAVVAHAPLYDDLAWDDQLDNGDEMSL
jgi:hypothetical protein